MGLKLPAGISVKYNAGNSTLFFHGTPRDLNFLEELVAAKSAAQPLQVIVSATFLEVNQADLETNWDSTGFGEPQPVHPNNWFMGGAGTDKNDYNNTVLDSVARVSSGSVPRWE